MEHHTNVLRFLALSLRSVDPSPGEVRKLTDQILNGTFANEGTAGNDTGLTGLKDNASIRSLIPWRDALRQLLVDCGSYRGTVADEINKVITETVESDDHATRAMSLSFAASFPTILDLIDNTEDVLFWDSHVEDLMRMHTTAMLAAAETDAYVRIEALQKKMITADQALRMPGGLSILFQETYSFFARGKLPYLESVYIAFQTGWTAFTDPATVADLTAVGRYLQDNPEAPWLRGGIGWFDEIVDNDELPEPANKSAQFNPATYLGAAAILSILTEHGRTAILLRHPLKIGPLCNLVPYLSRRRGVGRLTKISDLPVPDDFKQTFRDWAEGRVNFSDRSDTANRIGQYL